jgi:hypothetical protein
MDNFIEHIKVGDIHFASIVRPEFAKEGLNFTTEDEKFIQVGIWNYKKGKILDTHFHNTFERSALKTCESVYVVYGKVLCNLYFENGKKIGEYLINKGEMILQFNGAHEYEILENSLVIENKNGPYFGPEKDRTRI